MKNIPQKRNVEIHSISLSKETTGILQDIANKMELNKSQSIAYCIRTIFEHKMYGSDIERLKALRVLADSFSVITTRKVVTKENDKKQAVITLGGTIDGNIAKYIKYELTPMGAVVALPQALSLDELPSDEVSLRKFILGPFLTVAEAKKATTL